MKDFQLQNVQVRENKFTYKDDKLVNDIGQSVMMGWERPLMKRVSEILTFNKGDVLNIGFGMGIIDGYIRDENPNSHTVIEYHPDVIYYIKENGWENKANFIYSKWQDQIGKIGPFDSIYLDTWNDRRVPYINDLLDKCLKVGGVFSIWYNKLELDMILENITSDYEITYEYFYNDGIIPSANEQYENGGFYIDPDSSHITIPIITRLR